MEPTMNVSMVNGYFPIVVVVVVVIVVAILSAFTATTVPTSKKHAQQRTIQDRDDAHDPGPLDGEDTNSRRFRRGSSQANSIRAC